MRKKINQKVFYILSCGLIGVSCSCASSGPAEKAISEASSDLPKVQLRDTHGQDTLVAHTFIWDRHDYPTREWRKPNFKKQEGRIGWTPTAFEVPKGLEVNVEFWKNIYQKYSSDQGVLHDSFHIDLVYEEVDFTSIMRDRSLDNRQKLRARRRMVDNLKDKVKKAIHDIRYNKPLDEYAKKLKEKIAKYDEKDILKELPQKGRLRFQLGQKDYIKEGIYHSGAYFKEIERIFSKYNLPKELTRLAFVESSFNLRAHSKVGASGIWQIMPSTARGKLPMNYYYDYRNHPIEAAHVAAKLLRYNYKVLGDWARATTAYNYGAAGMRRLSAKLKTEKIEEMVKLRDGRWGFAASNFFASYLAVLDTELNAETIYGHDFHVRESIAFQKVKLSKNLSWGWFRKQWDSEKELKMYNPHFKFARLKDESLLKRRLPVYFPANKAEQFQIAMKETGPYRPKYKYQIHRVARGENLSVIARRYGVSIGRIMAMNDLSKRNFLRIGQKLRVPIPMN